MERPDFKMKSGIYTIRNEQSGKVYVGSAVYLRGRYAHHLRRLSLGRHKNRHLQNAWNRYGPDVFTFEVLNYCEKMELISLEQRAIDMIIAACGQNALYNINLCAESRLGMKHSAETKAKIGAGRRGKRHSAITRKEMSRTRKGRKLSAATRKKLSEVQRGHRVSEEQRAKTSLALAGHAVSEETRAKISASNQGQGLGRRLSEETKRKISQARKGCVFTEEHKAALRAAKKGSQLSEEHKARIAAGLKRAWAEGRR